MSTYDAFQCVKRYFTMAAMNLSFHSEMVWLCTEKYWYVLVCYGEQGDNKFSMFYYAMWGKG